METVQLPTENAYGHTKKLRFILDVMNRTRAQRGGGPLRVLDFGCGNGSAVTQHLAAPDIDLHGVDIHAPSLAHARMNFARHGVTFHEAVPEDVTFDVIVYADVLEHLFKPATIVREHIHQLVPGGVIVGAVPNGYGPFEIEHRINHVIPFRRLMAGVGQLRRRLRGEERGAPEEVLSEALPYNHESGHLVFFTRKSLHRMVEEAGLEITHFAHGSVFCGPISTPLMRGGLVSWNVRVADRLPFWAVSVWYFEARLPGNVTSET